jgi:AcrR family transcriptional regulator
LRILSRMDQSKEARSPQQKRSVETKGKILDAAYRLFCEKGYHSTTTNEIARVANVNIGSLYSYFRDKERILLEVASRHQTSFLATIDEIYRDTEACGQDLQTWMRRLMINMIRAYTETRAFKRELELVQYSFPDIARILDDQRDKLRGITRDFLARHQEKLRVSDLEAASVVTYSIIDAIVNHIVLGKAAVDEDRILGTAVDAIFRFLIR